MKNIILCLIAISFLLSCNNDDDNSPDCTIDGRWIVKTDDPNTLYEFLDNLRYTIYNTNGQFGTIADAIPNPNDYYYEEDELVIDLNFGNFSRNVPVYSCDCNVVSLGGQTLYKESHDINVCE